MEDNQLTDEESFQLLDDLFKPTSKEIDSLRTAEGYLQRMMKEVVTLSKDNPVVGLQPDFAAFAQSVMISFGTLHYAIRLYETGSTAQAVALIQQESETQEALTNDLQRNKNKVPVA